MATFETTQFAAQDPTRENTSRNAAANVSSGRVEYATIQYTLDGTEAAADVIKQCVWAPGIIPLPALSSVTCADPGTTLTLDVGSAANADGYADGITLSNGGQVAFTSGTVPEWITPTALVADTGKGYTVIYATVASAATLTASVVLTFTLAYKRGL